MKIDLPLCFLGFRNSKDKTDEDSFFLKNGAVVLEKLILFFHGKCNPIRTYSAKELEKATNKFDWSRMLYWGSGYRLYKGVLEDHEISVKKFELTSYFFGDSLKLITNEVAVASRMSNHKNVLKLLGCCLETEFPMLVYEFLVNGNLSDYFDRDGNEQLPFEIKLRIVLGIANSVVYLHHGLSKTFIHRDLNSRNVFLDHDFGAKLSEFELSIPIPEGKTHVNAEKECNTIGFFAREVELHGRYTEKSDVYNFGILLCELLMGKKYGLLISGLKSFQQVSSEPGYTWDDLVELWKSHLEANILQEENRAQKMECAKLAERCLEKNPDDRPNMIDVAKAFIFVKSIQS